MQLSSFPKLLAEKTIFSPLYILASKIIWPWVYGFLCECMLSHSVMSDCGPMDCSQPGSSVYGIFQARKLERVTISYSRGSSRPRDQTHVPCIGRQILYLCATCEAPSTTILGVKDPDSSLNSATLI